MRRRAAVGRQRWDDNGSRNNQARRYCSHRHGDRRLTCVARYGGSCGRNRSGRRRSGSGLPHRNCLRCLAPSRRRGALRCAPKSRAGKGDRPRRRRTGWRDCRRRRRLQTIRGRRRRHGFFGNRYIFTRTRQSGRFARPRQQRVAQLRCRPETHLRFLRDHSRQAARQTSPARWD